MIKIKNSIKLFLMLSAMGLGGLGLGWIYQESEKPSEIYDSQDIVGNSSSQAITENIASENSSSKKTIQENYLNDPGWWENSIPTNKPSKTTVNNAVVSTTTTDDQNVQSDSPQVIEKEEITVPVGKMHFSVPAGCTVKLTKTFQKKIQLSVSRRPGEDIIGSYAKSKDFEITFGSLETGKNAEIIKVLECEKSSIEGIKKKITQTILQEAEKEWAEDQKYLNQEGKYWGVKTIGSGRSKQTCIVEVTRPENYSNPNYWQIPKNCPSEEKVKGKQMTFDNNDGDSRGFSFLPSGGGISFSK